ncbi:fasciclin-like arabinogalactan protein 1 [Cucurbita moschata]|uniref:Fasciclin-like arabinogalactan protein 1 n=1 Tax=Cucurbita moschata TaxID=3662 RepID=A0A6J1FN43_CUCMO|nr:fasciclin-like arabinogalactan protein 1 [Cucurbita moschata]
MQQLRCGTAAGTMLLAVLLLVISAARAHNITKLLAKHPEFSTFNDYLTTTHLAPEINRRTTITVCAVDNSAMSDLLAKKLSIYSIKHTLSLHVLLDYYGANKLHQITNGTALVATMFQTTGAAPGASGFVNITNLKGGKVGFALQDSDAIDAMFVKSVEEAPYNISVIHISKILPSEVAEAPTPSPSEMNLNGLMSAHGCKVFADALQASDAAKVFQENAIGGLTIFCPVDDAFKAFLPKYKNLTAAGKISLLEYHGLPVYMSMSMLKSNNGVMNTLATDGASKYDFIVQNDGEVVTIQTKVVTAKVTSTLHDEQPVAIYTINKVLKPIELFKASPTLSPSPAPAPEEEKPADAPKPHSRRHKGTTTPAADSPDDSPSDEDSADKTADDTGSAARLDGWRFVSAGISGLAALLLL